MHLPDMRLHGRADRQISNKHDSNAQGSRYTRNLTRSKAMKRVIVFFLTSLILLNCLSPLTFAAERSESGIKNEIVIFDFQHSDQVNKWLVVNDGVMGGLSQSEIVWNGKWEGEIYKRNSRQW